jgi:hypothetical protein
MLERLPSAIFATIVSYLSFHLGHSHYSTRISKYWRKNLKASPIDLRIDYNTLITHTNELTQLVNVYKWTIGRLYLHLEGRELQGKCCTSIQTIIPCLQTVTTLQIVDIPKYTSSHEINQLLGPVLSNHLPRLMHLLVGPCQDDDILPLFNYILLRDNHNLQTLNSYMIRKCKNCGDFKPMFKCSPIGGDCKFYRSGLCMDCAQEYKFNMNVLRCNCGRKLHVPCLMKASCCVIPNCKELIIKCGKFECTTCHYTDCNKLVCGTKHGEVCLGCFNYFCKSHIIFYTGGWVCRDCDNMNVLWSTMASNEEGVPITHKWSNSKSFTT